MVVLFLRVLTIVSVLDVCFFDNLRRGVVLDFGVGGRAVTVCLIDVIAVAKARFLFRRGSSFHCLNTGLN